MPELEHMLARIGQLSETNPMMGHRGCRLGITYPEIIAMQTRAILRAAIIVQAEGIPVEPEIMIPLVSSVEEIRFLRKVIEATAEEVFAEEQETVRYRLGTMIELPRAAICAGAIACEVDFLSFGTDGLYPDDLWLLARRCRQVSRYLPGIRNLERGSISGP